MINSWLKGDVIYQNKWSKIYLNSQKQDNKIKEIYTIDFGNRSAVILNQNSKLLFVKQYRLLLGSIAFELPGGKVEEEESFEEGALRECIEETGYRCESLKEIAFFHPGLETLNNPTKIFYSDNFTLVKKNIDSEILGTEWICEEKVLEMLLQNKFPDSLTQIGLLNFFRIRDKKLNAL